MKIDYFDILAIAWLIIGLFWGRKRGMSQELLPLLQWLGIVIIAGVLYQPLGDFIHANTFFNLVWSDVTAYLIIASGVHLVYFTAKQVFGSKLAQKNVFGNAEFYLGMAAGATRFACMLIMMMALMNSRIETDAELAKTEKFQKDNFSDVRFPTYGGLQRDVLFKSASGRWVRSNLNSVLIATVVSKKPELETGLTKKTNTLSGTNMIASAKK